MEEALGAAKDLARRWDEDAYAFIVGASTSMDKAKATRMKRLYGDALMVLGVWVCLYSSGVLTGVVQQWTGRGLVVPLFCFFAFLSCAVERFASSV